MPNAKPLICTGRQPIRHLLLQLTACMCAFLPKSLTGGGEPLTASHSKELVQQERLPAPVGSYDNDRRDWRCNVPQDSKTFTLQVEGSFVGYGLHYCVTACKRVT